MIRAWWERRKQRAQMDNEERLDEYRKQDVAEAVAVMLKCATPTEALEAARLVLAQASTSFGKGEADKKPLYGQITGILGKLEAKLEGE